MSVNEESISRALADLRSDVSLVRRYAVRELGRWADQRVLPALQDVVSTDAEVQIRAEAAQAIEAIRLRVAANALRGPDTRPLTPQLSETVERPRDPDEKRGSELVPTVLRPGSGRVRSLVDSQSDTVLAPPEPAQAPARSAQENLRSLLHVRTRSKEEAAHERRRLIDEAIAGLGIPVTPKKYGFKLDVPLLDGRRQFVRIAYEQSDFEDDKVVIVFSPCGPAKGKMFRWALELNHRLTYGKLGLHPTKDGDEFVMSAALVEATADPVELRKAILAIAEKADKIEKLMWSDDRL